MRKWPALMCLVFEGLCTNKLLHIFFSVSQSPWKHDALPVANQNKCVNTERISWQIVQCIVSYFCAGIWVAKVCAKIAKI